MTDRTKRTTAHAPSPLDDRTRAVADRLHARSRRQARTALAPMLAHAVTGRLRHGSWDPTRTPDGTAWLADKLVALDPDKAALCYQLCRAIGARRVIEAGTSYGVSTLYLAAAVRDNLAAAGASGEDRDHHLADAKVFGTEHEPGKAAAARTHLAAAGLADHAEILTGDLRETLPGVDGPVDFLLVDIWIPMALPALRLVTPKLRPGALVVCDNVVSGRRQYADYLDHVRDPAGPFTSVTIPGHGGLELSRKN